MIKQSSHLPEFLVTRYRNWKSTFYAQSSNKFKKLANLGQNPNTMIISCCDSRVHATSIFGAQEGDFFMHRNIANLVPPFSQDSENYGTLSTVEYAVKELKVLHIVILGHTGCGGIKASYNFHNSKENSNYVFINKWLNILKPAFKNIPKNISKEKQIQYLEEESIKNSVLNLLSFPDIKIKVENKNLSIHGLIHDIGSGDLKYLNSNTDKFENI